MADCLLCCSPLDPDELDSFLPCSCRYRVCTFCFHQVCVLASKEGTRPKCPGCRVPYASTDVQPPQGAGKAAAQGGANAGGQTAGGGAAGDAAGGAKGKARRDKVKPGAEGAAKAPAAATGAPAKAPDRRHLASLRVVQRNLVYVVGLTMGVCREEVRRLLLATRSRGGVTWRARHTAWGPQGLKTRATGPPIRSLRALLVSRNTAPETAHALRQVRAHREGAFAHCSRAHCRRCAVLPIDPSLKFVPAHCH